MRNTLARRQLEIIKRHFRYKADEENHNRWCYRTKDYTSLLILYFRSYSNFCAKIAFFSCIAENISVFNKIFVHRRKFSHFHHFFRLWTKILKYRDCFNLISLQSISARPGCPSPGKGNRRWRARAWRQGWLPRHRAGNRHNKGGTSTPPRRFHQA